MVALLFLPLSSYAFGVNGANFHLPYATNAAIASKSKVMGKT
jgi:hypothetical protein